MWLMLRLALLLALICPAFGQLPEFYKTVSRVTWVTPDTARTAAAWAKFGLSELESHGEADLPAEFRGKPAVGRVRWSVAWFGPVAVDFIEPSGDGNAFAEFLKKHGEGVFALMHETGSLEALEREVERLRGLGVAVLQRASEPVPHVYFDTAERGKYVLGLVAGAERREAPARITQFAFAIREIAPVSGYWKALGWPAMTVTRSVPRDMVYRGKPVQYELEIGWQRHGITGLRGNPVRKIHRRTALGKDVAVENAVEIDLLEVAEVFDG